MEQKVENREQKYILLSYKKNKMRIAICEKDQTYAKTIKDYIYRYAEVNRLDIVVDCYSYGEALLCSKIHYNLIFIGYELVDKKGLELAIEIRSFDTISSIVFISKNVDIIFETFKVNAYRFLVPPLKENELCSLLDDFFNKFGNDYPLWIRNSTETYCLNSEEIYYIEADNKHCIVHLKREALQCNKTMAKVSDVLPKSRFIKINRAYIVNMYHITKYNNENIFLRNGDILHISRNYLQNFKENYLFFINPRIP